MLDRPPLSLALASLRSSAIGGEPRAPIEWAAGAGFRSVAIDAAAAGMRPRELSRSARRDLAALLRRLELGLSGIDLWAPSAHFVDPALADRALGAALAAIDLASDLKSLNGSGGCLSLTLPRELPETTLHTLVTHASDRGVRLADHTWPPREPPRGDALGVGIDPASVLLAGDNPAKCAARLGERLACARLSDASEVARVEPGRGQGRLNDLAYVVALHTAKHAGPVVLDLRGVPDPTAAAPRVLAWWLGP